MYGTGQNKENQKLQISKNPLPQNIFVVLRIHDEYPPTIAYTPMVGA
jgi:hypothetical protein